MLNVTEDLTPKINQQIKTSDRCGQQIEASDKTSQWDTAAVKTSQQYEVCEVLRIPPYKSTASWFGGQRG